MRASDLLALALSAVRQHRTRTVLTTLGVVFGTLVLAASVSVGLGVQGAMNTLTSEFLRQVHLWPQWGGTSRRDTASKIQVPGTMSEARRDRLREAIAKREAKRHGETGVSLTQEKLAALATIPHVEVTMPFAWQQGNAVFEGVSQETEIGAARPNDAAWRKRLVAGRFLTSADEQAVVVSEALVYLFGVNDENSVDRVLGKKLRLEFPPEQRRAGFLLRQLLQQFPEALDKLDLSPEEKQWIKAMAAAQPDPAHVEAREFTIVGVMRAIRAGEERLWWGTLQDGDVVLPYGTARDLFFKVAGRPAMDRAVLVCDKEENVDGVLRSVHEMGFSGTAPVEEIRRQRLIYLLVFSGQACVAIIALIVAGLGIANTMLISVLERTREIGIMKAIGADNRHLQGIFLVEGAIIGCVGGGLGLLLAWVASFPGNAWVQSMVMRDFTVELEQSIFAFPWWLAPAVFCFAVSITVLAAVFPAKRAARVDPVTALRYE